MKQTCCCRYLLSDRFSITHHLLLKGLFFPFFPVTNGAFNPGEPLIWTSESFCSRGTEKRGWGREGGWVSCCSNLAYWQAFQIKLEISPLKAATTQILDTAARLAIYSQSSVRTSTGWEAGPCCWPMWASHISSVHLLALYEDIKNTFFIKKHQFYRWKLQGWEAFCSFFSVWVQDHPWGLERDSQKYQVWFLGARQNSAVPERHTRKFCVIVFQCCVGWNRFSAQESVRHNGYPSSSRHCVGRTPAQQCWCNSCCARRDVPGNACTAIQAIRAKEPYSLCLN